MGEHLHRGRQSQQSLSEQYEHDGQCRRRGNRSGQSNISEQLGLPSLTPFPLSSLSSPLVEGGRRQTAPRHHHRDSLGESYYSNMDRDRSEELERERELQHHRTDDYKSKGAALLQAEVEVSKGAQRIRELVKRQDDRQRYCD